MKIIIEDKEVRRGGKKMQVDQFCRVIAAETVTGMRNEPIPDNVRWVCEKGDRAVYIVELQPELRTILWGGAENSGLPYTVATPYVVLKVPFIGNALYYPSVFYRNEPLQSINDRLYHSNLKNVAYCGEPLINYLCLDGLRHSTDWKREQTINELVNHLWSGEFNDEMSSHQFGREGDDRLQTIQGWQKASKEDPEFVLGVNWKPTTATVKTAIEAFFDQYCSGTVPQGSNQLGSLLLAAG